MFEIRWDKKAKEELKKFEIFVARRIVKKIKGLANDPHSGNVKRLVGSDYYRLRVGDYRVIFDIKEKLRVLLVLKIGHRKNVYKKGF